MLSDWEVQYTFVEFFFLGGKPSCNSGQEPVRCSETFWCRCGVCIGMWYFWYMFIDFPTSINWLAYLSMYIYIYIYIHIQFIFAWLYIPTYLYMTLSVIRFPCACVRLHIVMCTKTYICILYKYIPDFPFGWCASASLTGQVRSDIIYRAWDVSFQHVSLLGDQ